MLLKIETVRIIPDQVQRGQLEKIVRGLLHGTPVDEAIQKQGIQAVKQLAVFSPQKNWKNSKKVG